jgi:hypothetical protein
LGSGGETPEGDKRSVVEVQVDEIGPSLRWRIAKVELPEARADASASHGGQFDEPLATVVDVAERDAAAGR